MVSRNAKDNILDGLLLVLKMFSDIIIFQLDTLTNILACGQAASKHTTLTKC